MTRRQSIPVQWVIFERAPEAKQWTTFAKLPRGSGVLLLVTLEASAQRRLRRIAVARRLAVYVERPRTAARVHDQRELTRALLKRTELILISPVHPTRSHPGRPALPRMRAAALARLTPRRAIALGGMDRRRYATIAPLGFVGWAGISAFRT